MRKYLTQQVWLEKQMYIKMQTEVLLCVDTMEWDKARFKDVTLGILTIWALKNELINFHNFTVFLFDDEIKRNVYVLEIFASFSAFLCK